MKRSYELQSIAFKNAWVILRKNNGNVEWKTCCKLGWNLAKRGKRLEEKLTVESVYKKYYNEVYNTILKMTNYNIDLAEDITSETFTRVCAKFDSYDIKKAKINTWIITIAKNILIDHSRISTEKLRSNTVYVDGYVDEEGNNLYQIKDVSNDGLHNIVKGELKEKINRAFKGLNDNIRQTAILFFVEENTYIDIAKMLNLPIGTVKTNIFRSRKLLQKKLKNILVV